MTTQSVAELRRIGRRVNHLPQHYPDSARIRRLRALIQATPRPDTTSCIFADDVRLNWRAAGREIRVNRAGYPEAIMGYNVGVVNEAPCRRCLQLYGPLARCKSVTRADGTKEWLGSCTNCVYSDDGVQCTHREDHGNDDDDDDKKGKKDDGGGDTDEDEGEGKDKKKCAKKSPSRREKARTRDLAAATIASSSMITV